MHGKKQNSSVAVSIALGAFVSILTALLCVGIAAVLVLQGNVRETGIGLVTAVIIFAAAFIGALIAGKKAGGKYGTICGAVLIVFLLIQIGTNIIFFDGTFRGFIKCVISLVAGGGLSCLLLMKGRGKRRKKR